MPDESFDLLNLFSSLGYLGDEEDTHALAEFRRVLRPDGRLVIETMHRDPLVRDFAEQDWQLLGEGRLLLEQRTFDPRVGRRPDDPDADRRRRRARVAHVVRARLHRDRAARDARPRGLRRGALLRRPRRRPFDAARGS